MNGSVCGIKTVTRLINQDRIRARIGAAELLRSLTQKDNARDVVPSGALVVYSNFLRICSPVFSVEIPLIDPIAAGFKNEDWDGETLSAKQLGGLDDPGKITRQQDIGCVWIVLATETTANNMPVAHWQKPGGLPPQETAYL